MSALKIAILGCGPAGLVAAHAARRSGGEVTVFSMRRKSTLYGSQLLKQPIPGVPGIPQEVVHYCLIGRLGQYLQKIYGYQRSDEWTDVIDAYVPSWDIRATYNWLWDQWRAQIIDLAVGAHTLSMVRNGFDIVISSIPGSWLCDQGHTFAASYIWAAGDAPDRGILIPDEMRVPSGQIVRDGMPDDPWTRISNTYGHVTVEWPDGPRPWPTAARVPKPLWTDCSCWPTVARVGRYGKWHKDGLVHDVYDEVRNIMLMGEVENTKESTG